MFEKTDIRLAKSMNTGVVLQCRWIMAAIITLVVFAPMMFFDMTPDPLSDCRESLDYPIVTCLASPTYDMSQDAADLYAWLAVASPMTGAHPDYNSGFSKYGYPYDSMELSALPEFIMKDVSSPSKPGLEAIESAGSLNVAEKSGYFWEQYQFDLKDMPQFQIAKIRAGGYWRFADGTPIENAPQIPPEILDLLSNEIKSVVCTGSYEIAMSEEQSMMPYIILRRSCGSSKLDLAASRILWSHVMKYPDIAKIGKQIEIDWRGGNK